MEFTKVGIQAFFALGVGAVLAVVLPIAIAVIWKIKKKEPITTLLIGAATFLLFALILEKPIQNVLIFPAQLGLPENPLSRFLNANPVWLSLAAGLFPGIFEETGRLVAFKTVLKKKTNRETAVSHGIGHGGFEVICILGMTYATYLAYAVMINTGAFGAIADQVAAQAPAQMDALKTMADQIAAFTFAGLGTALIERVFAVLLHIGASILVFYACRDAKKFWLYPLAVVLHTGMDFVAALSLFKVIELSPWALEAIFAAFGILLFGSAYWLLYRRDKTEPSPIADETA